MENLKVHTAEFTRIIDYELYRKIRDFLFNGTERCYTKGNKVKYEGFASRGIRLELMRYTTKEFPNSLQFKIKYIFTPSRFINSNDYLGLTDITELSEITYKIGAFLFSKCELLPHPLDCGITRIDLTKDLYVGNNTDYLITLLNRSYIPYKWERIYKKYKGQATLTKKNIDGKKIFEFSAYDKFKEMQHHVEKHRYCYPDEVMERAKGILRLEFRIYNLRLKNMKKKYHYQTAEDFFKVFQRHATDIVFDTMKKLYLVGTFYKLNTISDMIEFSYYQQRTKRKMQDFIQLVAEHKSVQTAACVFEDKYNEKTLKDVLKKFNAIGIIPNPISRRSLIEEWSFFEPEE